MKPDISRWRDHRSYDFYDSLPPEGLAWECLRRDKSYQAYYRRLTKAGAKDLPLPPDAEQCWGLRFRRESFAFSRSTDRSLDTQG